ncbi:MAG: TonB-dependent receptor [Saprospiraceae bacterium]|nr:TonB-dependent receptor [Saprospiraceae bacterium]
MKAGLNILHFIVIFLCFIISFFIPIFAQNTLIGNLKDAKSGEPLIGATVILKGSSIGTTTDFDGQFLLKFELSYPISLEFRYSGYATKTIDLSEPGKSLNIELEEESVMIDVVEISGQRISDKQKASPLTVESMDLIAIRETPSASFYDGLGSLKDVDLTTASLGFTIINTRGFNSTSPVRSLQIIDGVDNQSPGLNFSLGNFLGSCELDVNKVDLIVGASSAFYGPNAFNGVISMETKNPFIHKGLSFQLKAGERNLLDACLRWADAFKNKDGHEYFAYKLNLFYLTANDWEAENYDAVYNSISADSNPGGYDAVNIYGDEYQAEFDYRNAIITYPGLGIFHRRGYREKDLVDYHSQNFKGNAAFHFRLKPALSYASPELIFSTSLGGGSTVYQGDNRYSLKNITFFQHRLELLKREKYFLRFYATHENSGDSYDPYFTALKLQQSASDNFNWVTAYSNYWTLNVVPKINSKEGYPKILDFLGRPNEYKAAVNSFLFGLQDSLSLWHSLAQIFANTGNNQLRTNSFFEPGSAEFQSEFDDITSRISFSEGGTKFYDRSALVHGHGEYIFSDLVQASDINDLDIVVGASARIYYPDSKGSILLDTGNTNINTYEYGLYAGGNFSFLNNEMRINLTGRVDKHENFEYLFSPAASIVYQPSKNNYLRVSFSSAIRNPTLSDQYLHYNVGRAILLGNINGINDLITVNSFVDFLNSGIRDTLEYFNVPAIRPEKVKTIEIGYRTTLLNCIYADLGYYYSKYEDFIGYQIGINAFIPQGSALPTSVQAYRVSANAKDKVTTQGFSIGLNYFFNQLYQLKGNYSWNILNTQTDDPIIPAFNTPEHKYNLGISGRDLQILGMNNFGFNINYKWIKGFIFEGSPQFTGYIPTYSLTDAQINWNWKSQNTTFKLGASNVFNQKSYQTYGGPLIGRLAYISILYEFKKN